MLTHVGNHSVPFTLTLSEEDLARIRVVEIGVRERAVTSALAELIREVYPEAIAMRSGYGMIYVQAPADQVESIHAWFSVAPYG